MSEALSRSSAYAMRAWLPALAMFLLAFAAHAAYVHQFGAAIPFWDQWDAEGNRLIRLWLDHNLGILALLEPHNEHRILPTRLFALLVFELNGGTWNNLAEAYASAALYALGPAVLAWTLMRAGMQRTLTVAALLVLAALAVLPYGWENTLVGFQTQFYFVSLFTVLAIVLIALRPDSLGALALALLLCLASAATMASGLISALAVAVVVALNWRLGRVALDQALLSIALLAGVAVMAYATMPAVPAHAALKASSPLQLLRATLVALGWPSQRPLLAAVPLWLPGVAATILVLARRVRCEAFDLVMLGCLAWSALQCLAIGYGRGNGIVQIAPRYSDFLAVGALANTWFLLRLVHWAPTGPRRLAALTLACCSGLVLSLSFIGRFPTDLQALRTRAALSQIQTHHVVAYLTDGDPAHLQQPLMEIPYPDPNVLRRYLDDPTLRSILPFPEARKMPVPVPVPVPSASLTH